jgi:hypothetical protein
VTARGKARLLWEVARAFGPMALIELSLRSSTLPATCRRLGVSYDPHSGRPPATVSAVLPHNTRAAVRACLGLLSVWPGGDTCLRQCLLIGYRMRRLEPVLRIGVMRDENGVFSAHSWLEINGGTLDPSASQFTPLGRGGR